VIGVPEPEAVDQAAVLAVLPCAPPALRARCVMGGCA
jgi:hypothetical protein